MSETGRARQTHRERGLTVAPLMHDRTCHEPAEGRGLARDVRDDPTDDNPGWWAWCWRHREPRNFCGCPRRTQR